MQAPYIARSLPQKSPMNENSARLQTRPANVGSLHIVATPWEKEGEKVIEGVVVEEEEEEEEKEKEEEQEKEETEETSMIFCFLVIYFPELHCDIDPPSAFTCSMHAARI